jgi:flavin-dependent dehydrogenase
MFDAIVVGGRCAGAATALLLARKGYKVLIVDKAGFPSEIPHGHFVHRQGPRLLQSWGVLEEVIRSGCPPVTSFTSDFGDFPLVGADLVRDGVAFGYGPRRSILDRALVEAAVKAGAEFRDQFSVDEYLMEGEAVSGIRGRASNSHAQADERARIVIGADGRHSSLARAVGAPMYDEAPPLTCWYFSYWSGAALDGLLVHVRGQNVIFAFPTNDCLTAVFVAWPLAEFSRVRASIERSFLEVVRLAPLVAETIFSGKREERFYGAADLPNFFRKPYGAGWALVGDAGHHKDPFLALGICDAFRDANLLASAIDEGFSGERPIAESLGAYERDRNSAALELYWENISLAQFRPIPQDVLGLRAALRQDPEETRRFYMAREGMIPPKDFFNQSNLARLSGRGGQPARTSV